MKMHFPAIAAASFVLLAAVTSAAGTASAGLLTTAAQPEKRVIARVWHGKTLRAKADEYEHYLSAAIAKFPTIRGNLGYQLLRLDPGTDGDAYVEFQVISYWESLDAIKAYAGADVRRTHDLPRDAKFLVGMEPTVRNYNLKVNAITQ